MSKKSSASGKAFSYAQSDDASQSPELLYSQISALNTSEDTRLTAQSTVAPTTRSQAVVDSGPSLAPTPAGASANAPAALTYPSTSISKVYQHWADGDAKLGTSAEWNNNILSDGKSDYFEGEVVPHVYFYKASNNTPMINGQTYSFNVTYNHYQANTNAGGFVYMTSPNASRNTSSFAGGDAQADSAFTNGGGMQGSFHTVNANITAVSGVTYSGSAGSSVDGKVTVKHSARSP